MFVKNEVTGKKGSFQKLFNTREIWYASFHENLL